MRPILTHGPILCRHCSSAAEKMSHLATLRNSCRCGCSSHTVVALAGWAGAGIIATRMVRSLCTISPRGAPSCSPPLSHARTLTAPGTFRLWQTHVACTHTSPPRTRTTRSGGRSRFVRRAAWSRPGDCVKCRSGRVSRALQRVLYPLLLNRLSRGSRLCCGIGLGTAGMRSTHGCPSCGSTPTVPSVLHSCDQ